MLRVPAPTAREVKYAGSASQPARVQCAFAAPRLLQLSVFGHCGLKSSYATLLTDVFAPHGFLLLAGT